MLKLKIYERWENQPFYQKSIKTDFENNKKKS